ncbi:MAG TPA: pyroglutamyl-peptidase I [Firmicutes bacterium]|nr:pyroglutamyl-peptidase I [Bacillota bacterium]
MNLLITGFEPFGGEKINPSQEVIENLPEHWKGLCLHTKLLPVVYDRAENVLFSYLDHLAPQAVLCLGVAAGRASLTLERIAVNIDDADLPDNEGALRQGSLIDRNGPAAYFSTLPLERIRKRLQDHALPSSFSLSAGGFLCNHVFYCLMKRAAENASFLPAGFIHLPALPAQAVFKPDLPSLPLSLQIEGVLCAAEVIGESLL